MKQVMGTKDDVPGTFSRGGEASGSCGRAGRRAGGRLCARGALDGVFPRRGVLFNGSFLSFDLSSGSKGQSHLPLSAKSVWQGQEFSERYSRPHPQLRLQSPCNQSDLSPGSSQCVS